MREIRTLRAMWRVLETESRSSLNGHEEGNLGYSQGKTYGPPRQRSTLPGRQEPKCRLADDQLADVTVGHHVLEKELGGVLGGGGEVGRAVELERVVVHQVTGEE